ncbi:hypothetical protein J6590_100223, partial [Homalodisca vitripennis]
GYSVRGPSRNSNEKRTTWDLRNLRHERSPDVLDEYQTVNDFRRFLYRPKTF